MRRLVTASAVLLLVAAASLSVSAEEPKKSTSVAPSDPKPTGWASIPLPPAAQKGVKWLVLAQNEDGGWGPGLVGRAGAAQQDASDLGNTAVAAMALLATGSTPAKGTFQGPLRRATEYVMAGARPYAERGLDATPRTPRGRTQLEGKIGRYAPALLSAAFLTEVDGRMGSAAANRRVRRIVTRLTHQIVAAQSADGSWNAQGGWAPIHSTAIASKTLWAARALGIPVSDKVFERVEDYTLRTVRSALRGPAGRKSGGTPPKKRRGGRRPPVVTPGPGGTTPTPAAGAAGVPLYTYGQALEQITRTPEQRERNATEIERITRAVSGEQVLKGLGSMGGEEFISYHNINLAMARIGGRAGKYWDLRMKTRVTELQNRDGSWSGHHCITGRTACTAMAVLTLVAERSVPRTN